jgi:hypothetical protein
MFWVLIYIATNFLAPIPLISVRIDDFSLPICAQIDEQLAQNFSKKSEPEKAGLRPG